MSGDTELLHQDDVCNCGAKLDCWEGEFPEDGYIYTKWICQSSERVVADQYRPINGGELSAKPEAPAAAPNE